MLRFPIAGVSLHLGFFIITTAPLSHLSEGVCVALPNAAWQPEASLEAAFASGSAEFELPPIGSGFNRTVNLDGFETLELWSSSKFAATAETCDGTGHNGELILKVTDQENGVFLRFDNVNCPLSTIAIRKNPEGERYEASIRFQFEWCKAAAGGPPSPVSSAAVVLGLEPTAIDTKKLNMMPWLDEICNVKPTLPPTSQISVQESANYLVIGNGTCKATSEEAVADKTTVAACRAGCEYARKEKDLIYGKPDAGCSGFAFKAGVAPECIMYKNSAVTELAKKDEEWLCESLETSKKTEYNKTQGAASPMDTLGNLSQSLHFASAMDPDDMSTAKLYEVQSEDVPACFRSSWFFMFQNEASVPAALPVIQSQWAELMDRLPEPPTTSRRLQNADQMQIAVTVDRVLVVTKNSADMSDAELNKEGWNRQCIEQKAKEKCDGQQMVNSIVTGIVVPCIGWAIVWLFYKRLPTSCMLYEGSRSVRNSGGYDEGEVPTCKVEGLIACCMVAVVFCGGLGFGTSALIEYAFGAAGCLHGEREMLVVGCATAIPAAFSMIIGLMYMHCSGRKHSESGAASRHYDPPKGKHLMLVEVPDADGVTTLRGEPLNPDILLTGNSAMASYRGGNSIQISTTGSDIAAYQSMNNASVMSTMRPRGE